MGQLDSTCRAPPRHAQPGARARVRTRRRRGVEPCNTLNLKAKYETTVGLPWNDEMSSLTTHAARGTDLREHGRISRFRFSRFETRRGAFKLWVQLHSSTCTQTLNHKPLYSAPLWRPPRRRGRSTRRAGGWGRTRGVAVRVEYEKSKFLNQDITLQVQGLKARRYQAQGQGQLHSTCTAPPRQGSEPAS
jgi:hypothetical protein